MRTTKIQKEISILLTKKKKYIVWKAGRENSIPSTSAIFTSKCRCDVIRDDRVNLVRGKITIS